MAETSQEKAARDLAEFQENAALLSLANNLGSIVGSEAFCGFTLDQEGLAKWIEQNVPPERMDFPGLFQMSVLGQKAFNDAMTESAKTAHCAAVIQSAHQNGLLK